MTKVLLTGATGLLGNAIARALIAERRNVRALVRTPATARPMVPEPCEIVAGDVTDPASLRRAIDGCTVVYHAAGLPEQWLADPTTFRRVNTDGTRHLTEVAREARVTRFVYTSTIDVFRFPAPGVSFNESEVDPHPKATAYERSKQDADRIVTAALADGLPAVFLHPAGIYGPGPSTSPGTNHLIADLLRTKIPMLLPGGMPLVHSDDAANAHLLAEAKAAIGARYIVSESYASLLELARLVRSISGSSRIPPVMPIAGARVLAGIGEAVASIIKRPPLLPKGQLTFLQYEANPNAERAKRELGWQPRSLTQGVAETIDFLRREGRC
jgi:dihydroflavonol-4-reductase